MKSCPDIGLVGKVSNSIEALDLIRRPTPDVVIFDLYMPELDSLEVIRYTHQQYPDIKTILISAYRERVYEELVKEEGTLGFIPVANPYLHSLSTVLKR